MERIDYALLFLRISFGLSMAYHGYNKISSGISGTAGWFSSIGMKWPKMQARVAATTEVVAGVLFAAGLFTSIAAMAMVALMVVAIITVHWKVGYFIFLPNGGWEYCASIAIASISVGIAGPGQMSLDHAWGISNSLGWMIASLGIVLALCHLALSYRPLREPRTS